MMKVDEKLIHQVLNAYEYVIPPFQRPYSWTLYECGQLWDDLTSGYDSGTTYFLGSIVYYLDPAGHAVVIDGQQRLTTLSLLLAAFNHYKGQHSYSSLVHFMHPVDMKTMSPNLNKTRVLSQVQINNDAATLLPILQGQTQCNGSRRKNHNMEANYCFFVNKIAEWRAQVVAKHGCMNIVNAETTKLIEYLLGKTFLLIIECISQNDALTIFQTINDRGMQLSESDIFKASLYQIADKEGKSTDFTAIWDTLSSHTELFKILMHIYRAKDEDRSKAISLRDYWLGNSSERLGKWRDVLRDLVALNLIEEGEVWVDLDPRFRVLREILSLLPNTYWKYPIYIFLLRYGQIGSYEDNGQFCPRNSYDSLETLTEAIFYLDPKYYGALVDLLEKTIIFLYIKGVLYRNIGAIRDIIYDVNISIWHATLSAEESYTPIYQNALATKNDLDRFLEELRDSPEDLGSYLPGLVLLGAYLHEGEENKEKLGELLLGKWDVEHILPRQWNNYDGWTDSTWAKDLNRLGNLVPLEKRLNIRARDSFFSKKQKEYQRSKVLDAQDLWNHSDWTPDILDQRDQEVIDRIDKLVKKLFK